MTFYKNLSRVAFVVSLFVLFGGILPDAVSAAVNTPTCTLSASPSSVSYGGTSMLEWNTTDADTVYINNGIGYVNLDGSVSLSGFSSDVTYTLTAINAVGSRECSAKISVENGNSNNYLAPTCNITASPESVSYNGSTILNWNSIGATTAVINSGVGAVQKQGSKVVEHITDTTTFKLTVSNTHGSNTCSTTVYKDTAPAGPAPTCTIDVDKDSLSYSGNAVLTWRAYHSNSAQIDNGVGYVAATGSKLISPSNSTTYTMTVQDSVGRVGYCAKTVTVQGSNFYGGGAYPQQYNYNAGYTTYGNTISLASIPYTGASDVLYVLAMLLIAAGSTFGVYKVGRELA